MTSRPLFHIAALIGGAAFALTALAHSYQLGPLAIGHPWARATAPGQPTGGGYLKVTNGGAQADRLVSASSPMAKSVQIHQMSMDGDVMRMRELPSLEVAAGQTVEFKPGGYHLMLVGLSQPMKAGDSVPLTLKFEKAGSVEVQLKVEAANATPGAGMASGHGAMPAEGHEHQH